MKIFSNENTKKFFKPTLGNVISMSFIFSIIGTIHSLLFNESRLIIPTDTDTYEFRIADLILGIPLVVFILSICIASVYYPLLILNKSTFKKYELGMRVPKIHNKRWLLGFAGLLGFIPFFVNYIFDLGNQYYIEVIFFAFFSQFSYCYQNKFSDVLVDERFLYNLAKAESKAYRTAYAMVIIALILSAPRMSGNVLNVFLLSTIALSYATAEILKSYYLYKYDMED